MNTDKRISPNKEKYNKEYWLNYYIERRFISAMSRARKNKSLAKWANVEKMKEFYRNAVLLSDKTGTKYQVDHIIPIKGENVCGLHVENNLSIITKQENCKKYNFLD